jgi:ATP-binding cassette, subfamily B, multidrug efflux pump
MSDKQAPATLKETERIEAGPGHGRGPMGGGMVAQKANAFGPSARRLVRRMAPYRAKTLAVIALTVVSVLATAVGPRVLGHATDLIFTGLIGGRLPAGMTKEQAVELLRSRGEDQVADMVSGMDVVPGLGVDFTAVGQVLLLVLAIYVGAAALGWLAGSSTTSCRAPCGGCARTSRTRCTGCRWPTSTASPAASC